jgi:hypothetical protein
VALYVLPDSRVVNQGQPGPAAVDGGCAPAPPLAERGGMMCFAVCNMAS